MSAEIHLNKFMGITRKATGFKYLQKSCWEINPVTSKRQIEFFNKTCKKGLG